MGDPHRVAVGIDGGQSTIRLAVEGDPDIRTAAGVSHHVDDVGTVVDRMVDLLGHERSRVGRIVAGLSTLPADACRRAELAAALSDAVGVDEVWLTGDDVTAHVGAFWGASGVLLAAGTGIACMAVDSDGVCRSFDGAGYLIGDEGGAFWLGRRGVRAVIASFEGRGPSTSLTAALAERFDGIADLGARVHALDRPVDAIAHAAVDVLAAAEDGDEVAGGIVDDGATRLARTVSAAAAFAGLGAPVVFDGRLLGEGSPLAHRLVNALADQLPDSTVTSHPGAGLSGAMRLARLDGPLSSSPALLPYLERFTSERLTTTEGSR